ncbi:DNA repair ATPase [Flavobacterium sp. CBA20B-1]|uniref:DNA repair ATPase n=2 Tax=unclassified Flavobacterium TaxID=196869 RepID=UPI0022244E38|nr:MULTISPECIES: DNA repair ATPase [unclassified Flavobacterium]WCM40956.1 DNA repair ATPase [Flavobacterium sp. CBA20B-1]
MNMQENQNIQLDSGTYEIIKRRLQAQKEELVKRLSQLNNARKEVFNSTNFVLKANQRIDTENTCTARGIVAIDNLCIFGYNVHFGLRTEIKLNDVFSIYQFENNQFIPQSLDLINDANFITDYQNLYKYYRDSIFSKFRKTENYLYMIFQTSKSVDDLKAFKWLIKDGQLIYQDDRSIHEVKQPAQFEFQWIKTNLEDRRLGKFPHISILDKVFIEALHGDITFKIEDNTETGKGIFSEKVTHLDQQLDDAEYYYADLGNLIAVRIKPYQEDFRAYVFNLRTKEVINLPSLNHSAILLPDNQGIIFSNGYYLQNGTHKVFDSQLENVQFLRKIASPNGEDFLYVFNHRESNTFILMSYNIIQQAVETPIVCNGFTIFKDGSLTYFKTEPDATRHHQVQIWETPYMAVLKENEARKNDPLYKVGNKQIVQAMAEAQEVIQLANKEDSYEGLYEEILKKTTTLLDSYFWINDASLHDLGTPLSQLKEVANTAIDEFVKVQAQRKHADELYQNAQKNLEELLFKVNSTTVETLDQLVHLLAVARKLQGEFIDLKNVRYMPLEKIEALTVRLQELVNDLSNQTIEFLLQDEALLPYEQKVTAQKEQVAAIEKVFATKAVEQTNNEISSELELLIDMLNSLKIEDATQTTKIVEKISVIFSSLNEVRAQLTRKIQTLRNQEAGAEFAAQLTLLEQTVTNYLELATSAEKTDEYYTKVIVQLEELESKFADIDDFALKIADKRDEVVKAFHIKREQIVSQINKRADALEQIGLRVLKNIENKAETFTAKEAVLSFFASDLMVDKIRQLVAELKTLNDVSKAENLENLLKKAQEDTLRILRDKKELYVNGENIIALGKHHFSVNTQALSLTLVNRNNELFYHLTGTSFYQKVQNEDLVNYKDIWNQELVSENSEVYRASYLAYQTFLARNQKDFQAENFINQSVEKKYSEGYIKGVHNHDALLIYNALAAVDDKLGALRYSISTRAIAQLFWHSLQDTVQQKLQAYVQSAHLVLKTFPNTPHYQSATVQIQACFEQWETHLDLTKIDKKQVANYLFETFSLYNKFAVSETSTLLKQDFLRVLNDKRLTADFQSDVQNEQFYATDRYYLILNWLHAFVDEHVDLESYRKYIEEAAVLLLFSTEEYQLIFANDAIEVNDLKGNHNTLQNGLFQTDYYEFTEKLADFTKNKVPRFEAFVQLKNQLSSSYEKSLKINELQPKVLTSFVRNKLINEVYFPLIGNNLAKQLGTAGENKRTARMGMLLLISPPGYGKTTLMEYLAKTMGLHFVKVNGPTIGHSITSIDPLEAKTSGEREELKKINLSFEMADNVMLYLDDIQHLSPEFLQKFISLADGQRKIDGIFDGESKTYDLRGKRFCIVMAGNPYTESGSKFQIPDMLANRADVYNLGDVIGDTEHLFHLSLLENAAVENKYLEKIVSKSFTDFYTLVDFVTQNAEQLPDLEGNYSKQEIDDFVAVMKHLITIRNLVIKVNQEYIQSAAMQDAYRTEPSFKMQGSYRNMSKLVAQVVPMMNEKEINDLMLTHYESESQTLTADTESNLLKLKELAGLLTVDEKIRWEEIKELFRKNNKHGGLAKDDKVFAEMLNLNENLEGIIKVIKEK